MSLFVRLRNVFRSERLSVELDDELAFHIAEREDEFVAQGMSGREARRKARALFGNYSRQKETTRDMNLAAWLEAARNDFSFGLRQLRLNPGFTMVAVLSLALGIGANTAIFQLVNAIRLRGLPVQEPSQLAVVDAAKDFFYDGWYSSRNVAFASTQLEALRQNQQAFSDFFTFNDQQFNLSAGGQSRYANGLFVRTNFLSVLGVKPVLGRDFSTASDSTCEAPGAVLNYAFWQREFGSDLKAIGKSVSLDGHRFPIVGVTPASFLGVEPGQRFDVAIPVCAEALLARPGRSREKNRSAFWLTAIGRLKPGWSVERASKHMLDISPSVMRASVPSEYRPAEVKKYLSNRLKATSASAGVSPMRRRYENPLWILLGISGMVLLIACFNLANLLLARASAREREIAVRQAIGASRPRLVSQLLCESLLLAGLGGFMGAVLAQILSRGMVLFLSSPQNEVMLPLGVDWRTFAFTAGLALFTCLIFGLLPAIRASGANPANAMRGARTSTSTRERNGLRRVLVVSQVAFSLMLLVAAVLFTRSLQKLLAQPSGFHSQNVLAATLTADGGALSTPERRNELFRQMEVRLRSTPGVVSVASVGSAPFSGYTWNGRVHADNDAGATGGKMAWFNRAGSQYFATMGTPILAGREFSSRDNTKMPDVAVVNEAFSKRFFGGKNPVRRSFRTEERAGAADKIYQVVGMVGNTKYNDLNEDARPIAFMAVEQNKRSMPGAPS